MPAFEVERLFRHGRHELMRYGCDGHDSPRPTLERVGCTQLMFVERGAFEVRGKGGRAIADPTSVFVQAVGDEHIIRHPRGGGDVCLTVRGPIAERCARLYRGRVSLSPLAWANLAALGDGAADALALEELVCGALPDAEPVRGSRVDPLAEAIAHQVALRYAEPIGLSELAAAVGVSEFHACRVFKRARGTTIHKYRDGLRLAHAISLLLDGAGSIAEIAAAVGYASQAHLTHRMSLAYQTTPAAVRAKRRRR